MRRGRMGRPGLMGTMARTAVIAGTATAVSGAVSNKQANKQMAKQQQAQAAAAPAPAPEPAPAPAPEPAGGLTDDAMDQLKKLGDLKAAGVLSDEEFTAAKAKILGI